MSGFSKVISQIKSKPSSDTSPTPQPPSGAVDDLLHLIGKGKLVGDARTALQAINELKGGAPLDDRKLLLEHGVQFLQSLEDGSAFRDQVSESLIGMLWKDLPHPPQSSADPFTTYRKPDGSGNNPLLPTLGASGTPYARSVPPLRPKKPNLPDPGLVFDLLLKRKEFKPHPSGLSALFFSFATCVIHECFSTNSENAWINDTSSYVDLGTLYGNNEAEQAAVRTLDGKGTLWPDTIASVKLLLMPPSVGALLVLFSRNHNHIASRILQLNEKGLYKISQEEISKLSPEQKQKQDEDVFQKSRSVNVGCFASIVLGEYVACILNTYRADSSWTLNLGAEIKGKDGIRLDRGGGNSVSVEFNVLYRWHASLSNEHAVWVNELMTRLCPGKSLDEITPQDFYKAASMSADSVSRKSPKDWAIYGLKRDASGRYSDAALADCIKDATEEQAGAFGAHGSPEGLRVVEVIGQLQARQWNVATMNEFRKYLNLKTFDSFEEWNSDKSVAEAARSLYHNIDDLELYPGLLAEEAKPNVPGSGVCVGHTIGREVIDICHSPAKKSLTPVHSNSGILDDAVSLIRSDRFLTHDFSTTALTSWGLANLKPTPGAIGGFLPGILFTNLPNAFRFNSTYALMPFYTPATARQILRGTVDQYSTERHSSDGTVQSIKSFAACKAAFQDTDTFGVLYKNAIKQITGGRGFMIGFDDHARHDPPAKYLSEAFHEPNFDENVANFFTRHVDYQIKKSSLAVPGKTARYLDIVKDVLNVVPISWIANRLALPLKTEETPHGLLEINDLRLMLLGLFVFSSFNIIPKAGWFLRETSLKSAAAITKLIEFRIKTSSGVLDIVQDFISKGTAYEDSPESEQFYKKLVTSGKSAEQLAGDVLGAFIPIAGNITQQVCLSVDLYLRDEYSKEKAHIVQLCQANNKEADELLNGFIREGMRIAPVVIGLPRVVTKDIEVQDGTSKLSLKAGDKIIIGISKAHMDPVAFPNPEKIDPTRPENAYLLLGLGIHYCFGARIHQAATLASIKTIFSLKNLRRAPGAAGHFARYKDDLAGLDAYMYLDHNCEETPAPCSLGVMYDADSVDAPTGSAAVAGIDLRKDPRSSKMSPQSSSDSKGTQNASGSEEKRTRRKSGFFDSLTRKKSERRSGNTGRPLSQMDLNRSPTVHEGDER